MGYENLPETVELLIDAAIESHMHNNGWYGDVRSGFTFTSGTRHISPPGTPRSAGGQQTDVNGEPLPFDDGTDVGRDIYGLYESFIRDAFDGWERLPEPTGFDGPIMKAAVAAWAVALEASGSEVTAAANPDLQVLIYIRDKLVDMDGATIETFTQDYIYPLPPATLTQYAMAVQVDFTLEGQREVVARTRETITSIAENGLAAMRQARYQGGGGGIGALLESVGAIASIVGVFVTGGAAAPIIGGIGRITGALGTLLPPDTPPTQPTIPLWADTASACWGNIVGAIGDLRDAVEEEERILNQPLEEAIAFLAAHPGAADITAPSVIDETDPRTVTGDMVRADLPTLRRIATVSIPRVAQAYLDAASNAARTLDPAPWKWPPETGIEATHPQLNMTLLAAELRRVARDTAWELTESGEALQVAVDQIDKSDQEARAAMDRQRRGVDRGSPYAGSPLAG